MTAAELLATEIGRLLSGSLTEAEEDRARLVYDDTVGCILSGLFDPQVSAFAVRLPAGSRPELVTGRNHPPGDLAMLLGFAATADELDEGHYEAGGHPAAPVVSAILAETSVQTVAPSSVLRAFVAGYEAGGRLGRALTLRRDVHPHGTWGCVGAAMAVAILREIPAAGWPAVIDLAASLATATSFDTPLLGGSVRSAWIGVSARNGLLACDLAAAGVTSGPRAVERILGTVLAGGVDTERLKQVPGAPLMHMSNFMKIEASCRETQAGLAALDMALAERDIQVSQIVAIDVHIFEDAARLDHPHPVNRTAARFSIPSTIAARLLKGTITPNSFTDEVLRASEFRRLTDLTRVLVRKEAHGEASHGRTCNVVITLSNGSRIDARSDTCPGDPAVPFSPEHFGRKFT